MDRRQPPPRRRLLKSGKILLGTHPVPCIAISPRPALAYRFKPQPAFPGCSSSFREAIRLEHARSSGVTTPRSGSCSFSGGSANRSVIRPLHNRMPAMSRIGRRRRTGRCRTRPVQSPPRTPCIAALSRTYLRHAQRFAAGAITAAIVVISVRYVVGV